MYVIRAALAGALVVLLGLEGGSALAQTPAPPVAGEISTLGAQTFGVGPQPGIPQATPLFKIGGLAVGIWTRVPPPYNVAANRSAASNPLP